MQSLDQSALDLLFFEARSRNGWSGRSVPEALLEAIWDIARMGPTSANCQPLRIAFIASADGKAKLAPALSEGNRAKALAAPVTAIFAYDMQFFELLPKLFPHNQAAREWFAGDDALIGETAFRNGTLQAAYFMLAARAKGLDCGPMSGFDRAMVDAAFFSNGRYKSNFLCSLGYGTDENLFSRSPRLAFDEACRFE
jgi:3-hydroxypropanoate dehydrogenase